MKCFKSEYSQEVFYLNVHRAEEIVHKLAFSLTFRNRPEKSAFQDLELTPKIISKEDCFSLKFCYIKQKT